jgi:hypothetical protein
MTPISEWEKNHLTSNCNAALTVLCGQRAEWWVDTPWGRRSLCLDHALKWEATCEKQRKEP